MNSSSTYPGKNNKRKLLTVITFFILAISIICLIINFSIDHVINWSLYPTGALVVVLATISPLLLFNTNKSLGSFVGLTVSSILYLFLIQSQVAGKGWLLTLALPVALLSFGALGLSMLAFKRFKINKLYAIAITIFLFGVIVNSGVGIIVGSFLKGVDAEDVSRVYTIAASTIAALLLTTVGYIKNNKALIK